MKFGDKLYAYAGRKSKKLYPDGRLFEHPQTAKVALREYLKWEPNPETGGNFHRTDTELNTLMGKFVLMSFRIEQHGEEEPTGTT